MNGDVMRLVVQCEPPFAPYFRELDRKKRAARAHRDAWHGFMAALSKGDVPMAHGKLIQMRYWDRQAAKAAQ